MRLRQREQHRSVDSLHRGSECPGIGEEDAGREIELLRPRGVLRMWAVPDEQPERLGHEGCGQVIEDQEVSGECAI